MRGSRVRLILGGLTAALAVLEGIPMSVGPGAFAAERKSAAAPERRAGLEAPSHGPMVRSANAGLDYGPSFAPGPARRHFVRIASTPNPLVTTPYPATPEYSYLYVTHPMYTSPPSLVSYKYVADNKYLLSAFSVRAATASAYKWRHCASSIGPGVPSLGPSALSAGSIGVRRSGEIYRPGQKGDAALKPSWGLPEEPNALRAPGSEAFGTKYPCYVPIARE